ncbi:plasmalemma vesicle associated protein b [Hippoglossus hippoglossus]|uniref:plasmalemma vesicle associated protein b n=1 Tax=Hippoglossus hippoglossus TaxID=8267 RepID=UPI00148D407E|nr:plasmalemma vesicle associated protein b [Hippoglossus hippoglossus]
MYSSSYSQAKFGLEAREPLHKPKGKSCGYYMRIVFFFSSLIQSLIIVSLVLFLIYGQPEKSAEEKRVEDLELNFNRLSEINIQLRKEKGELGAQLAARTGEKAALEKELAKLKTDANNTEHQLKSKVAACVKASATTLSILRRPTSPIQLPVPVTSSSELRTMQSLNAQQKAMINLIQANFTQMVQYLSQERDNALKDRDTHHQDAISLRRENTMVKEHLTTYTRKCKEDFAKSLDGIMTVTRDFLNRINNLFPQQLTFHLTCDSQHEQMEKIRNSCTNLSRDVENKFQIYLDKVGNKVSEIQALSSRLEVQTIHLSSDLQQCEQNRSKTIAEAAGQLQLKQRTHDDQVEKLLMEQNRLRNEKKLLDDRLGLKEQEVKALMQMAQSALKPGVPKLGGLQAASQQDRQTVPNWSNGANGINKPATGR